MEVLVMQVPVSHLDVTKLASVEPPGEDTICCPVERVEPGGCHTKRLAEGCIDEKGITLEHGS